MDIDTTEVEAVAQNQENQVAGPSYEIPTIGNTQQMTPNATIDSTEVEEVARQLRNNTAATTHAEPEDMDDSGSSSSSCKSDSSASDSESDNDSSEPVSYTHLTLPTIYSV